MLAQRFRGGRGCKDVEKGQILDHELLVARQVVYPHMQRPSYEYGRMTKSEFKAFCEVAHHALECLVDTRNVILFFDIDCEIDLPKFLRLLATQGIERCILLDSSDFLFPQLAQGPRPPGQKSQRSR